MADNKKVVKSAVWFTMSNFLMRAVGIITTPIFTRLLTKAEYGDYNNFQVWVMIMLYITSLNLESSMIVASQEYKEDFRRYTGSMIALSLLSSLSWMAVCNLFFPFFSKLFSLNRFYLNCMFLYLIFMPAVNLFQNAERYEYKYKLSAAVSVIVSVGTAVLSVVLIGLCEKKLDGMVLGYVIPPAVVGGLIMIWYFFSAKKPLLKYWKYALVIALPYIPHLLSMYLLNNMDKVMIRQICGSEDVALYSLAYNCGMIITILNTSLNSAFGPWLAERLHDRDYRATRKISVPYVAAFSALSIGAVLLTPELLYILGGKSYMSAVYVMPPVAAGCLLQFAYGLYVNVEQYNKKTVWMAFASGGAALLNFVLNFIFIRKFGYVAAAYTTYAGYLFLLIVHVLVVRKIGMQDVYDNRKILAIALGASALMFAENMILERTVIRYILIGIYFAAILIVLIKNKARLKRIWKNR
ncbi:MAG: lipopolysaccharide biosynthesis protein [Bilifractor sp.]|jgi:O-antigen/teichoic acid export membrane protein